MHWRNSDFQIRHFLAGSCHTPDAAYRMLMELREERTQALSAAAHSARCNVWKLKWLKRVAWISERIAAELDRMLSQQSHFNDLVEAAIHELGTIDECIAQIQPHRVYSHLPDAAAHQAAQEAEWLAELCWRAENYLLTGGIPHDQLAAMRMHPQFSTKIWPHVLALKQSSAPRLPGGTNTAKLLEVKHADTR